MQVFVVGTPLETAECLDNRRLHKQIVECGQILSALEGKTTAWKNHPCTKQYRGYETWLKLYRGVLENYGNDIVKTAELNKKAMSCTPCFHRKMYFDQMKRRLYTKDKTHYKQFSNLGESDINWYWSQETDTFVKYKNGKKLVIDK